MAIREGAWDCSSCGKTNRGRDKSCRSCGNPKDDNEKFYLPDDAEAVEDEKLLEQAEVGPDWSCSYCGSANTGDLKTCKKCGAAIEGSEFNEVRDYETDPQPGPALRPSAPAPAPRPAPVQRPTKGKPLLAGCGCAVVVAVVVVFGYLLLATSDVEVRLTGFSWQRSIDIEKHVQLQEEDWSIPAGGEEISRSEKIHHYDQVLDHYETRTRTKQVRTGSKTIEYKCGTIDKGNGFFEDKYCTREEPIYKDVQEEYQEPIYRKEPRYQTWYVYNIWRWKPARTESSAGSDHDPYWPRFESADKERESGRKEKYEASFTDPDGKTHKMEFPLGRWQKLESGATYVGKMNMLGTLLEVVDGQ